ncbi:hypothetical protein dsx2_2617 [Desulfovibrio sp. X2]|nr:hypothetical protein dsx2_2617 [Desulfovibrio sp. X2]
MQFARARDGDVLARVAVVGPTGVTFRVVRGPGELSEMVETVLDCVEIDGCARVWLPLPLNVGGK